MRRKDKALTQKEAYELLNNCEYGVLSTMGEEYPYGTPLNYVFFGSYIYFHCANEGHKLDNIFNNENISFCVVENVQIIPDDFSTKYRSVVVFGKAKKVMDQEEKREALIQILEKYSKDFMKSGKQYLEAMWDKTTVIKIEIEHMTIKGKK